MLTPPEILVIATIILLFVLIFATRLKTELIALIVLLVLTISGLVTPDDALSGFSSTVVITLLGLFVITDALEKTGVVQWVADRLHSIGRGSQLRTMALFMGTGAALSLIMNNVAAGAVLLPAAVNVARTSDMPVSKLLLPMSFGTLVGGMATYLTTANILMSELLITRGYAGLSMLDFIPTGSVIVVAAVLYMVLIGQRLLPERSSLTQSFNHPDLKETYHLTDRLWHLRVLDGSRLAGQTIGASAINAELGLTIAAIWRTDETITIPKSDQMLYAGDELLIVGREGRIHDLTGWGTAILDAEIAPDHHDLPIEPIEIIIAPRSEAIGRTLSDMKLNSEAGLLSLALWRDAGSYHTDVRKMSLQVGDAVLVIGESDDIQNLANNPNYILPAGEYSTRTLRRDKAPYALGITALVLGLGIANVLSLPIAMLAGAVAMVVTGCMTMSQFYEAISWRVIFLVAGMLPLSFAITESGLADRIGAGGVIRLAGAHPLILIASMVILTTLVVQIIGGQVSALLVGPIAINVALQTQLDPRVMAIAVAMACSMAFLTPIAHPVNILIMGPGGYRFKDFFVIGAGMTIVTLLAMLLGLSLFWGVR